MFVIDKRVWQHTLVIMMLLSRLKETLILRLCLHFSFEKLILDVCLPILASFIFFAVCVCVCVCVREPDGVWVHLYKRRSILHLFSSEGISVVCVQKNGFLWKIIFEYIFFHLCPFYLSLLNYELLWERKNTPAYFLERVIEVLKKRVFVFIFWFHLCSANRSDLTHSYCGINTPVHRG